MGIPVKTMVLQGDMDWESTRVLSYKIQYPSFEPCLYQLSAAMINGCYRARAEEYQAYVEGKLYPQAVEQLRDFPPGDNPFSVYQALVTYQVTYGSGCIVSLYSDTYEYTGGAHGNTCRSSQTWNLQKCRRLRLRDLFTCGTDFQAVILERAEAETRKEPEIYFENVQQLLEDTFDENRFYCTPEGIVVYYLQYDIAPYSSGIREFLIPYGDGVYNPGQLCMAV